MYTIKTCYKKYKTTKTATKFLPRICKYDINFNSPVNLLKQFYRFFYQLTGEIFIFYLISYNSLLDGFADIFFITVCIC